MGAWTAAGREKPTLQGNDGSECRPRPAVSAHFLLDTRLDSLLILSPFPFSPEARPKQRKPAKSTPEQQTCSKWPKTGVVRDLCQSSAVLSPPFPQLPASWAWPGASPRSPSLFRLLRSKPVGLLCGQWSPLGYLTAWLAGPWREDGRDEDR